MVGTGKSGKVHVYSFFSINHEPEKTNLRPESAHLRPEADLRPERLDLWLDLRSNLRMDRQIGKCTK